MSFTPGVMPSAECHTDHRLVCCKITFHFKPKPRKDGAPRMKLKVCSLQSAAVRAVFQESLWSRLEEPICLADSPLAPEVLWGPYQNCCPANIWRYPWIHHEEKQGLVQWEQFRRDQHTRHTWPNRSACIKKTAFRLACSTLQRKLQEIQNEWWTNLVVRTQLCADTGDYRGFYEAPKTVYGPSYQILSLLQSADRK